MGTQVFFSRINQSVSSTRPITEASEPNGRVRVVDDRGDGCSSNRQAFASQKPVGKQVPVHSVQSEKATSEAVTAKRLEKLVEQQAYCCALSGLPLTPDHASLDHIVAKSDGGEHIMSNVQWLDPRVNRMKGTMSQAEFIEMCTAVAKSQGTL